MNCIAPTSKQAIVLYDGQCPLCLRSVAILKRLDWFKRLYFQDARDREKIPAGPVQLDYEQLLVEMHLVTPGRSRVYAGFYAFRWMAGRLPALLLFWPILFLPFIPNIGQRVYRWVAKNRYNLVPCHDGACALPLRPTQVTQKIPK